MSILCPVCEGTGVVVWDDSDEPTRTKSVAALTPTSEAQMDFDENAYQEYLNSQSSPALIAMERAGDRGQLPWDQEAYDEMVRQDLEGCS